MSRPSQTDPDPTTSTTAFKARPTLDPLEVLALACGLACVLLVTFAPDAFAASDPATALGDLLKKYAAELYIAILAIVSLIFLINRAYTQLGAFLIAAVVVGMLVVSPTSFKNFAKDTANTLFSSGSGSGGGGGGGSGGGTP